MTNFAIGLLGFIASIPAAALIRVAIGHPNWRWCVSAALIGALTALAACLWAFVPTLPE